MDDNNFKLESALRISDDKILHDLAILRMSKLNELPVDNLELLKTYNSIVSDLVELYNEYSFGKN